MKLYASGTAVEIRYPTAQAKALTLANELAARLDELATPPEQPEPPEPPEPPVPYFPFSSLVREGIATTADRAIYIGLAQDWAAERDGSPVPWWNDAYDFGIRVVHGADRLNPNGTRELHIIARDEPLLLRAAWLLLQELGWRHYMPNGVAGLEELWIVKEPRDTLRTRIDRVWSGAVDHLIPTIAGGTTNLNWSDGTNHENSTYAYGLLEGDLAGAIGTRPLIAANAAPSWLRHMGWTTSTNLSVNAAWAAVAKFSTKLEPWNAAAGTGHYTASTYKLYTDHVDVQLTALDYANSKVNQKDALDWVSLARPDGDDWEVDFNSPDVFGVKSPVTRQIQLANYVATNGCYRGKGIVIQAYGACAETPDPDNMPDPTKVCTIVVEAYRPIGKTVEQVIDDYVDADTGAALCPLGLYQYLFSAAWGPGTITASAGSPEFVVAAVNRVRQLPAVSPKVVCGEAMTEFGLYGLGYYCYMQMVLDVGRVDTDFTIEDFDTHAERFFNDLYPTPAVRDGVRAWYDALIDVAHKPLLSSDLLHRLWSALDDAMTASADGSDEKPRVVELCKFTRYLDLRNILEAAQAEADPVALGIEKAYDQMMEWLFRIRDSGLVDADSLFDAPLDETSHLSLGLVNVFDALNAPPTAGRGAIPGTYPQGWNTSVPTAQEFADDADSDNDLISLGLRNPRHGLTDIAYSSVLESVSSNVPDSRLRQQDATLLKLQPYQAKGKMKLWLIPSSNSFACKYVIVDDSGPFSVEFVNQASGEVDFRFRVERPSGADPKLTCTVERSAELTSGQLYEIRLTTYATGDLIALDWWSESESLHYLSFDPGREGDPCGFSSPNTRSFYFLVPADITHIHFYADYAADLTLHTLDVNGEEVQDPDFLPASRAYQSHPVAGEGDRVLRIDGIKLNQIGFWLLNCPNLFAQDPRELLRPVIT